MDSHLKSAAISSILAKRAIDDASRNQGHKLNELKKGVAELLNEVMALASKDVPITDLQPVMDRLNELLIAIQEQGERDWAFVVHRDSLGLIERVEATRF